MAKKRVNAFVILLIFVTASLIDVAVCQCTSGWTQSGTRCYLWQSTARNQTNAVAVCAGLSARLPVIKTSADLTNFEAFLATNPTYTQSSQWLGLIMATASQAVTTDDGTVDVALPMTWANGQPNGDGKCVMRQTNGGWNDYYCNSLIPFACEQSLIGLTDIPCALLKLYNDGNSYYVTPYLIKDYVAGAVTDDSSTYQYTNKYAATIYVQTKTQPLYQATYNNKQIMVTDKELSSLSGAVVNRVLAYFPLQGTFPNLVPMYLMWYSASNPNGDPMNSALIPYQWGDYVVKSTLYAFTGAPGAPANSASCGIPTTTSTTTSTSTSTSTTSTSTTLTSTSAAATTFSTVPSTTAFATTFPTSTSTVSIPATTPAATSTIATATSITPTSFTTANDNTATTTILTTSSTLTSATQGTISTSSVPVTLTVASTTAATANPSATATIATTNLLNTSATSTLNTQGASFSETSTLSSPSFATASTAVPSLMTATTGATAASVATTNILTTVNASLAATQALSTSDEPTTSASAPPAATSNLMSTAAFATSTTEIGTVASTLMPLSSVTQGASSSFAATTLTPSENTAVTTLPVSKTESATISATAFPASSASVTVSEAASPSLSAIASSSGFDTTALTAAATNSVVSDIAITVSTTNVANVATITTDMLTSFTTSPQEATPASLSSLTSANAVNTPTAMTQISFSATSSTFETEAKSLSLSLSESTFLSKVVTNQMTSDFAISQEAVTALSNDVATSGTNLLTIAEASAAVTQTLSAGEQMLTDATVSITQALVNSPADILGIAESTVAATNSLTIIANQGTSMATIQEATLSIDQSATNALPSASVIEAMPTLSQTSAQISANAGGFAIDTPVTSPVAKSTISESTVTLPDLKTNESIADLPTVQPVEVSSQQLTLPASQPLTQAPTSEAASVPSITIMTLAPSAIFKVPLNPSASVTLAAASTFASSATGDIANTVASPESSITIENPNIRTRFYASSGIASSLTAGLSLFNITNTITPKTPTVPIVFSSPTYDPIAPILTPSPKLTSNDTPSLIIETPLPATTPLTQAAASALLTSIGIDPASQSDSVTIAAAITAASPFLLASLSDAEKSELFVSMDDTINNCEFDGKPCDMTNDWNTGINPQYGNCFTFSGNDQSSNGGNSRSDKGLHLILKVSEDEYTCNSASAGFILQIHDPDEQSLPDTYGQYVPPGYVTNFAFTKTTISRLPPPYGTCINEPRDVPQYYYNGTYVNELCLRSCFQKHVLEQCGCGDPRYAVPDNAVTCGIDKKICVDNIGQCENAIIDMTNCGCADGCTVIDYSAATSSSRFNDLSVLNLNDTCSGNCNKTSLSRQSNAAVHIYFAQAYTVSYTEQPACDLITFLYNISNFPQMFTGFIVMSVFEVFGLMMNLMCKSVQ